MTEPTVEQMKARIAQLDIVLEGYKVLAGMGGPLIPTVVFKEIASRLKSVSKVEKVIEAARTAEQYLNDMHPRSDVYEIVRDALAELDGQTNAS